MRPHHADHDAPRLVRATPFLDRTAREGTYLLAMAAAQDAADAQQRRAGRTAWSAEDYQLALDTFICLMGRAQ